MANSTGYHEHTYIDPSTGDEVYGQDGHGWYGYADGEFAAEWKNNTPSKNSLFVYFNGLTSRKLNGRGYILTD